MIFVTVGSHEPFDRLVEAVDQIAASRPDLQMFGQITHNAGYTPRSFDSTADIAPEEYEARCAACRVLVAHAGMGTIITALRLGKPLVILPRRAKFGETRNDHQVATAESFADKPGIFAAMDADALEACLDAALFYRTDGNAGMSEFADDRLIAFLRSIQS